MRQKTWTPYCNGHSTKARGYTKNGDFSGVSALAEGFHTIAVKEAIGDRVPGALAWNLFDIDAKFADVESTETCF